MIIDHDHDHAHHHGVKHYHDEHMQSVSIRTDKPLDPDKFFPWVQDLVANDGPSILRSKGILSFKDDPERFVFQGVHMILDGDHQRPWKEGEARESRIVFIGRDLPEEKIRQGFAAAWPVCLHERRCLSDTRFIHRRAHETGRDRWRDRRRPAFSRRPGRVRARRGGDPVRRAGWQQQARQHPCRRDPVRRQRRQAPCDRRRRRQGGCDRTHPATATRLRPTNEKDGSTRSRSVPTTRSRGRRARPHSCKPARASCARSTRSRASAGSPSRRKASASRSRITMA